MHLASSAYAAVADFRNLLYDSRVIAARRAPVPVVSIGGLTVGGSGKTPIASDLARRLSDAGVVTAILTHGFEDELEVHRQLCPEALVFGGRDRFGLARAAAGAGAELIVLDSGFQYRRLHRDLDIVAVDDTVLALPVHRFPAGPFREGLAALGRADLVVRVERSLRAHAGHSSVTEAVPGDGRLRGVAGGLETPPVIVAQIRPGPLVAVTESAGCIDTPCPRVAVAGVMWPDVFFSQASQATGSVVETLALRDHANIAEAVVVRLRDLAGAGGIVCTLKDASKLARSVGQDVPLWYLSEHVNWVDSGTPPAVVRAALSLLSSAAVADSSVREVGI
jgi:tetraacyldisaccharide 4'-kinase